MRVCLPSRTLTNESRAPATNTCGGEPPFIETNYCKDGEQTHAYTFVVITSARASTKRPRAPCKWRNYATSVTQQRALTFQLMTEVLGVSSGIREAHVFGARLEWALTALDELDLFLCGDESFGNAQFLLE